MRQLSADGSLALLQSMGQDEVRAEWKENWFGYEFNVMFYKTAWVSVRLLL